MTKLLSLGVVATFAILLFTACTGKKQGSTGQSKKDSIALITDSNGISDQSFNEAAWQASKLTVKSIIYKKGPDINISNLIVPLTLLQILIKQLSQVMIQFIGYMLKDAVKAAAKKNFVIIDDIITKQKNVTSVTFKSNEVAYLAGVAAAYTTKTNKVAFIGGAKAVTIESFASGFKQGVTDTAKALNKKIEVTEQYIGNFTATDKAKSMAQSLYANKYDVIFHAAGSAGNGVFQETKAYNQMRLASHRVWVVGVDVDQAKLGNYKSKDGQKVTLL
ncbi:BMP family ABC transporter substrate-binding protein [Lactobacillus sp. ESL0225]|nr:BMP family ABC transporter substrate-binding protein [Lactobacillus sp. ESL0230]RMC48026.1 BMP family ABC transporter substrate-binding protein [Lactobacillus sp. ESL0225]